jgi:hypothetical protein
LKQHKLLDNNGKYPDKSKIKEVEALTGTSAMNELDETVEEFGMLEKLSPVFIVNYFAGTKTPKDFLFTLPVNIVEEKNYLRISNIKKVNDVNTSGFPYSYAFIMDEDHKKHVGEFLTGRDFWKNYIEGEKCIKKGFINILEVFIPDFQPGIARDNERLVIDEKYYSKSDYRMNKGFSFGVIAHFKDTDIIKEDHVFMGGERSLFKMNVEPINEKNESIFADHALIKRFLDKGDPGDLKNNCDAMCLISPLCVTDYLKGLDYSIVKYVYSQRTSSKNKLKSDSYNMFPPGTVLFPGQNFEVGNLYPTNNKIGLNWSIKFNRGF